MFIPVNFNLDYGQGKEMLFQSGYDMRIASYYSPTGIDLTDYPEIRSKYQEEIGKQNLELKLARLSRKKRIKDSINQMYFDIRSGKRGEYQAMDYYHNYVIDQLFTQARNAAWIKIKDDPRIASLSLDKRIRKQRRVDKRATSGNVTNSLLNIYK